MSVFRTGSICAVMILILAACAQDSKTIIPEDSKEEVSIDPVDPKTQIAEPVQSEDKIKAMLLLNAGVKCYEEGKYNSAEKSLKAALKTDLLDTADQVTAHKYLAFLYSVSNRKTLCRKAFEKAFELDPNFTLSPAEAGHPMWGPIYLSVKAKLKPVRKPR
jgi:Tfp pilus assembly protein PilF